MKKKALLISAIASNQGKTLLSMSLLYHYKNSVRPFKCGPDFIDPQFHEKIAGTPSINLDGFMMNREQLQWLFYRYGDKKISILEGVMGFYDGMDKGSSAYDIGRILSIPTLLILDGGGTYITLSAILKGMVEFRDDNTIKMVVLNKVSSKMHFELIKKHIELECNNIVVIGWIEKDLPSMKTKHLGLDLESLEYMDLENIAQDVLKHIDLELLEKNIDVDIVEKLSYPFSTIEPIDEKCVVVKDKNFSFIYFDNIEFLRELYREVVFIDSTKDEVIESDADIVIIIGGYVETDESYERVKDSKRFKKSLREHAFKNKKIYAECAGLIYLGKSIDTKRMSGILDIEFTLSKKRERLGYYYGIDFKSKKIKKGHAFHYSKIISAPKGDIGLYKNSQQMMKNGGYKKGNIVATYLHTMWRSEGIL